jgi:glycosyltransferase involved in cell wall biosynthesis
MNSGSADALTVESAFMEAYYRREGLPPPRLVVTGAISDDTLAEHLQDAPARRAALCAELGLPADRRLILCALPDDRLSLRASQAEFADYPALVQFVVQTLAATPGCNVVVRLHPRASYEAHRYIEQWGVRISRRDTAALVPLCDIYVASVSATIRWAIACGKPVVNYDVYRLRLTDYADAPAVIRVEDHAEFAATLHRLAADDAFYAEMRRRQQTDAPRWGQLDGQAGLRILKCLDTVISDSSTPTQV